MKELTNNYIITFLLFLSILVCFACGKEELMKDASIVPAPANDTIATHKDSTAASAINGLKYLALGDSYTIGQNVQENERFPAQTVKLLAGQNINFQIVHYIATTGWTTGNLINAIKAQNSAATYDIVTLLIGVNDQYQHVDTSTYRINFTALLHTAITLAGNRTSRVFVLSIPDYSATPFVGQQNKATVSREIDEFNAINKEISAANNIAYTDITPASREGASDPLLIASDGLHPSGKEYAKWAAALAPAIQNALK